MSDELRQRQTSTGEQLAISGAQIPPGYLLDNKFEIVSQLGKGGMSAVYLARHRFMNRQVAVKVLLQGFAEDSETFERFRRESEAASKSQHPTVVAVHDFGVTPEGLPYMIMDYAKGLPLSRLIKAQSLEFPIALEVIKQACEGIGHAHKQGVIHRDLKPGNIMVDTEAKPVSVRIVDFGIAKLIKHNNEQSFLTQAGQVFGSPAYMAPEQLQGHALDTRVDIYAMACVIYEIFTGKPPFTGKSPIEIATKHVQVEPPPLPMGCVPEPARAPLSAVLARAMAKQPKDRYATMEEFWVAIANAGLSSSAAEAAEPSSLTSGTHSVVNSGAHMGLLTNSGVTRSPGVTTTGGIKTIASRGVNKNASMNSRTSVAVGVIAAVVVILFLLHSLSAQDSRVSLKPADSATTKIPTATIKKHHQHPPAPGKKH
jgi:serine/threonine-protein kinase